MDNQVIFFSQICFVLVSFCENHRWFSSFIHRLDWDQGPNFHCQTPWYPAFYLGFSIGRRCGLAKDQLIVRRIVGCSAGSQSRGQILARAAAIQGEIPFLFCFFIPLFNSAPRPSLDASSIFAMEALDQSTNAMDSQYFARYPRFDRWM